MILQIFFPSEVCALDLTKTGDTKEEYLNTIAVFGGSQER